MKQLNRTHWFFGALLMMAMLLGNAFTSYAGQNPGIIDNADSGSVRGWAWNSSDPSAAVEVRIVVTNQASGQTTEYTASADNYRADLAFKGTGNYGFQVTVPWDTMGDGSYRVDAYTDGQKLSGSKVYNIGDAAAAAGTLHSLGVFKATGYCPCYSCSEGWGRQTSTGATASAGHTIAVDPRVLPYGSKVMVNGVVYAAEDRGGGVKGRHIDIFFNTHGETRAWGTRSVEVFLIQ